MQDTSLDSYIIGIGTDITDVKRVQNLLDKFPQTFLNKTFTDDEIAYCNAKAKPAVHFAARFAAKEAMAKALGTGFRDDITLKSLSVLNDELGKPVAVLDSNVEKLMEKLGAKKMSISLSHLNEYAQAFAILSK